MTVAEQLRRRADAAHRLPGGDPWRVDRDDEQVTGPQLRAWCAAIQHLTADGVVPVVPLPVLRELYRTGGSARVIAEKVRAAGGFAAA